MVFCQGLILVPVLFSVFINDQGDGGQPLANFTQNWENTLWSLYGSCPEGPC